MMEQEIGAVIVAAGLSSRMQGFKPLLHVREKTFLESAIDLFQSSGIADVLTVVGHRSEELIPVVEASGARYAVNDRYRDGMFSSVQTGVENLSSRCAAFFLLPVDIPLVQAATVKQLTAAFRQYPSSPVCYPLYNGRRGHPPLINAGLAEEILLYTGPGGLRQVLKEHDAQVVGVPVTDPFILLDVDTPEDLSLLRGCVARSFRLADGCG